MLTFQENRWNFIMVKFLSLLNYLPIQIDLRTGLIQKQPRWWRRIIWKITFILALVHSLYMPFRLVQSFVIPEYFYWEHFVFHFLFSTGYPVVYFWAYTLFIKNSEESTAIFNQLFFDHDAISEEVIADNISLASIKTGTEADDDDDDKSRPRTVAGPPRPRPLLSWTLRYSRHELLALTLPEMLIGSVVFGILVLLNDSTRMRYRSIEFLHDGFESRTMKMIFLALEMHFMALVVATTYFNLLMKLLFVEKCEVEISQLGDNLRNIRLHSGPGTLHIRCRIIEQMLKEMKEFFVSIQLFNNCFPFVIFSMKIFCLANAIIAAFVTIENVASHPFLSCFTANITINLIVFYSITFEKAHAIPREFEEMKEETLIVALEAHFLPAEIHARIRAIPSVGLQVGSFHKMERTSTPNFLYFVTSNLASLLITFG